MNKKTLFNSEQLKVGFLNIANDSLLNYYSQWTFDKPLIVSKNTNDKFQRIQKLLYRAICEFGKNYDAYRHLMPISDDAERIISFCKNKPYHPGAYRTDFMLDVNNNIKLIEITCRFALNGLFITGFFNILADKRLVDRPDVKKIDDYSRLFDYVIDLWGDFKHICFLKGLYNNNESKILVPLFKDMGLTVHVLTADQIEKNMHLFQDAVVFSEFNQEDWFGLPDNIIEIIVNSKLFNDPRTIFLIHDKRFFSVMHNNEFLHQVFTDEEIEEFQPYIAPTYTFSESPDIWLDARKNKDNWVFKPFGKGRSIDVSVGCCTTEEEWEGLFTNGKDKDMVLQSYINQRKFKGTINGKPYEDYAVGTLLFFNDNYFGPGLIRTSSYPVTNVKDDRKIAVFVTDDITEKEEYIII